jgi:hypothetical protein
MKPNAITSDVTGEFSGEEISGIEFPRVNPDEIDVFDKRGRTFADEKDIPIGLGMRTSGCAGTEEDDLRALMNQVAIYDARSVECVQNISGRSWDVNHGRTLA